MPTDITSGGTTSAAQETSEASNPVLSSATSASQDASYGADHVTDTMLALQVSSKTPTCRLLELRAEIRNNIYRFVLHRPKWIRVTATGYNTEGLLLTCKQVRCEANKIYYYENILMVQTPRYDPSTYATFLDKLERADVIARERIPRPQAQSESKKWDGVLVGTTSVRSMEPHWRNLLEWMRLIHTGALCVPHTEPASQNTTRFAIRVMKITAQRLRDRPWSEVKDLLAHHRPLLGSLDARWIGDEDRSRDTTI